MARAGSVTSQKAGILELMNSGQRSKSQQAAEKSKPVPKNISELELESGVKPRKRSELG